MQSISDRLRSEKKTIGLVPTMGYLHDGHLSLVQNSKKNTDVTVVSLFVNPTQFGPNEDLSTYPRDIERDKKLLEELGVDYLFMPSEKEVYPPNYQTFVSVAGITKKLEGEFRPTHFRGVTTVVSILFNSVNPHLAFFGQKDAQQVAVIKRMAADLKFNIKIVVCPIIREPDGLAMSSRNVYLNQQERRDALVLSKALKYAENKITGGEVSAINLISGMYEIINSVETSNPDYVQIVNASTFEEVETLRNGEDYYILIACKIGKTRLIDNILVKL